MSAVLSSYHWPIQQDVTVFVEKKNEGLEFSIKHPSGQIFLVPRSKIFGWPEQSDVLDEQFVKNCLASCREEKEGYSIHFSRKQLTPVSSEMLDDFSKQDLLFAELQLERARKIEDSPLLVNALSSTAKAAFDLGDYNRALECISEALQLNPFDKMRLVEIAGKCLVHLSKNPFDQPTRTQDKVAQELYALFYSYCTSSSTPEAHFHPLKEYIRLISLEEVNPKYSGWTLKKYCSYIVSFYHYSKCKDRVSHLISYLSNQGADEETFQEGEEIPEVLSYSSLKGGAKPSVSGQVGNFKYFESFPSNSSGPGPRGVCLKGMGICADYRIDPNPHSNPLYNKKQPVFYKEAAEQFHNQFLLSGQAPNSFTFDFGEENYVSTLKGLQQF